MIASESMRREWVLEPPEEILAPGFLQTLTPRSIWTTILSTLFSLSLAKTLWNEPLHFSWHAPSPFILLMLHLMLESAMFFYALFVIQEIVKLVRQEAVPPFRVLMAMGAVSLIPLHLTLPLALLCRPLGESGALLFVCGKLAIWVAVLRRFCWGMKHLFSWPSWAACLVVLSPLLLSCAMLLVAASAMVLSFSLAFLTLLG